MDNPAGFPRAIKLGRCQAEGTSSPGQLKYRAWKAYAQALEDYVDRLKNYVGGYEDARLDDLYNTCQHALQRVQELDDKEKN